MSDEKKPNRFVGTVRELFLDVRLMMGLIIGLVVLGAVSAVKLDARVVEKATEAVAPALQAQRLRIDAAEAKAERAQETASEANANAHEVLREQRALREDIRLLARGRPLPALPPLDGGTP